LAAKIDAIVKLGVVASLLIASSGVGYYYAVYLPGRDARLQDEQATVELLAYGQKRAKQVRSAVEQQQIEQRQAAQKARAGVRYQSCLDGALARHDASWSAACKRLAEQALQDHANCLAKSNLSRVYCDTAYRTRDGSAHCTLPVEAAADLDGDLNATRARCLRERDAALR
jgi:hypothetical protein